MNVSMSRYDPYSFSLRSLVVFALVTLRIRYLAGLLILDNYLFCVLPS